MRKLLVVTFLLLPALSLGAQLRPSGSDCDPPKQCNPFWKRDGAVVRKPDVVEIRQQPRRKCMGTAQMIFAPLALAAAGGAAGWVASIGSGPDTRQDRVAAGMGGGLTLGLLAVATTERCPRGPRRP